MMPMRSRTMRPSRTRPRVSTQDRSRTSMLPPQMTAPTLRPAKRSFSFISAATPAAPAPSATIFCCSTRTWTAVSIWPSSTSRMSATSSSMIGRVSAPGFLTAMPSASVWPPALGANSLTAWYMDGNSSAWTPIISISGLTDLAAIAMPEMMPPPPIGTTMVSSSGWSSSISKPMVPWPATILGSS